MRILAVLQTLLLVGCGTNSPDTAGVPLAFGLTSFSSKSSVFAKFASAQRTELIEDSSLAPDDTRPLFSIYTIRVLNVSDKEFNGELRLDFFNDRLMGVWFYPDNVSAYKSAMQASKVAVDRNVETWTAEDYRGKWYVAWEDKRLREQRGEWIDSHAWQAVLMGAGRCGLIIHWGGPGGTAGRARESYCNPQKADSQ